MIDSEAPFWLALFGDRQPDRRLAKRVAHRWCVVEGKPLPALFDLSQIDMRERFGLSAHQTAQLLAVVQEVPSQVTILEGLRLQGVDLIHRAGVAYPEALVERLPEDWLPYFLLYRGDLTLLTQPGLTVMGARQPSPEAESLARAVARGLSQKDHHLVGGYDQGVDRLVLDVACGVGGKATAIVPVGLSHATGIMAADPSATRKAHALVLSPYSPDATHNTVRAEARSVLVMALSEALLLIDPDRGPDEWPSFADFLGWGGKAFIWSGSDGERLRAWMDTGAKTFADASQAQERVDDIFGVTPVSLDAEAGEKPESIDPQPFAFNDAESAIEMLGRSGAVPQILARRLRESGQFATGYQADSSEDGPSGDGPRPEESLR